MRDFLISAIDKIVGVIVILGAVLVLVGTTGTLVSGNGGVLRVFAVLVGGSIYLLFMGGTMYLFLGIHANTRRTAELLGRGAGMPPRS